MVYTLRHQQRATSRKTLTKDDIARKLVLNTKWGWALLLCMPKTLKLSVCISAVYFKPT